ncbi:PREDICTED: mediator of RNA polymerase II transcription subunit 1-like [Rhagoletis zephyria]|uniref:mediator of RNA polymerase II transcription subunit 1-like n=1 Tax=Rhagoletis zephyria TaxID=28612 RepID=UPI0008115221|nr:PREDICTED: mediator of RNA polymerase II transcription subunit 1-like [Rhagoletis zephyria]
MSSAIGKPAVATTTTTAAQLLSSAPSAAEKNKQWQRELLMERIRSRSNQHKSFAELSKAMRMSMLEKRYALDAVEKANLQKCLDSMQHCIKVTSRQGLVERLESLSRQLGLKFMEDTSGLFISTDMFFLEIMLDTNGALTDVKVHHECKIEQQSCSELVNCLNRGDFADFTVQLEGLSSIYQLNAEPKVKTKAFVALQAMETDLYNLFQMQNFTKDSQHLVKASSVGLVLKRRGGHPMKLIYFVSPYDLISLESKSVQQLTTELITGKDVGLSVTVNLEASSANKLQILPIVSVTNDPQTGLEVPIYAPLTQQNSMLFPATFVLRLNKPLPVCHASLRALGIPLGVASDTTSGIESPNKKEIVILPIMNLVVQTASEQQLKNSQKGLFVNLPDQTHCYFFTENKQLQATLVSSIPYTEPMQVPKILDFLKRQALFYTLLASCVRTQSKMGNDMESTTILEVNAISFQQISVSLQHPYEESMATVEFDLRDGDVKCTIYSLTNNYDLLSLKLTKIVEKCLSIPVTIRALLKFWDQETMKMFQRSMGGGVGGGIGGLGGTGACGGTAAGGYGNFSMVVGHSDSGGVSGVRGGNAVKMEPNTRQQQMPTMASASTPLSGGGGGAACSNAAGVAGFLQYKTEVKQEDFHDSPKSQMQNSLALHAVESSSLGGLHHLQQSQLQLQHQQQATLHDQIGAGKQSEIEIADKYKNIWMDKTTNLKNCVSITPISPDSNSRGAQQQQQGVDVKRAVGIEIIPLTTQGSAANGGNGSGGTATLSSAPTIPQSAVNTSSTITITPINAVGSNSIAGKDKKSNSGTSVVCASGLTSSTGMSAIATNKRQLDGPSPTDSQKEKKRKKKRDDSPMGPPEKVYSRQNSPAATSDATATVVARKFSSPSSSPKGGSGGGMLGSGSAAATLVAAGNAALLSTRPSPKHSPVYSSPKHTNTASNSPKSPFGTHSPKHGSSGKPSMSTLKSATATSLSPKGDKSGCGSGSSLVGSAVGLSAAAAAGVAAANAVKSAMGVGVGVVGMQQMKTMNHLSAPTGMNAASGVYGGVSNMTGNVSGSSGVGVGGGVGPLMGGNGTGSSMDINTAASQAAAMRKVVGGAVSSMVSMTSVEPTTATQAVPAVAPHSPLAIGSSESKVCEEQAESTLQQSSSSEYMVKTSQEGLKLTINKTSSGGGKSSIGGSSSNTNNSGCNSSLGGGISAGSSTTTSSSETAATKGAKSSSVTSATNATGKKQHTGLKPGVNSGPASKKLLAAKSPFKKSATTTKHPFQKSNSSGSLSTKSSSTAVVGGSGLTKSFSTNSFGDLVGSTSGSSRKSMKKSASGAYSSTTPTVTQQVTRMDHQADMLKILQFASPAMAANMEGFMKGLNSKFQIPKLSQRGTNTNTAANGTQSAPTTPTVLSPTLSAAAGLADSRGGVSNTISTKGNNHVNEALQQPPAQNQLNNSASTMRSSPLHYYGTSSSPPIGFQQTAANAMQSNANYYSQQKTEGMQAMQSRQYTPANHHRQLQQQQQQQHFHQQQSHYQPQAPEQPTVTVDYHQVSAVGRARTQIGEETAFRSSDAAAAAAAAASTGLAGK